MSRARSLLPPRGANLPSDSRRPLQRGSATRARPVRSPNGATLLPRSPRRSRPPTPRSATPNASSATATKATLRVTYTVRNARWVPLYDARLDTGARDRKPALELVRRADITQTTGEDWSNVALSVSTVRSARGGKAPELNSLIVQYPSPPRPAPPASAAVGDLRQESHSRAV